jgi:fido (protein-threonine AMPylation protein)
MTKPFTPDDIPGSTPLNRDELDGLKPDYITTQGQLNELEQENILRAKLWADKKKNIDILTVSFLFDFHRRMLKDVWTWAGQMRQSEKTIGVPRNQILTKPAYIAALKAADNKQYELLLAFVRS